MTKEEILKLHELSEEEKYDLLIAWRILIRKSYHNEPFPPVVGWESLADCAFRRFSELSGEQKAKFQENVNVYSLPIKWIQEALRLEAE